MEILWPWFLVAQAALLPQLTPGTEVRLVSPDLLQVYAVGKVVDGRLALNGEALPDGVELRLLILPTDAPAAERAAAAVASQASGAPAPTARIVAGDLVVLGPDGAMTPLRELLAEQGIEVFLPGAAQR